LSLQSKNVRTQRNKEKTLQELGTELVTAPVQERVLGRAQVLETEMVMAMVTVKETEKVC